MEHPVRSKSLRKLVSAQMQEEAIPRKIVVPNSVNDDNDQEKLIEFHSQIVLVVFLISADNKPILSVAQPKTLGPYLTQDSLTRQMSSLSGNSICLAFKIYLYLDYLPLWFLKCKLHLSPHSQQFQYWLSWSIIFPRYFLPPAYQIVSSLFTMIAYGLSPLTRIRVP